MEQQVDVLGSCIRAPSIHALAAELQGRVLLVAGTNAADVAPDTTHKAQMLPSFFYRLHCTEHGRRSGWWTAWYRMHARESLPARASEAADDGCRVPLQLGGAVAAALDTQW